MLANWITRPWKRCVSAPCVAYRLAKIRKLSRDPRGPVIMPAGWFPKAARERGYAARGNRSRSASGSSLETSPR